MAKNPLDLYQEHYVDAEFERLDLFQLLRAQCGIESSMYPGSFVHVTPSFVFPITAYVELDKKAKRFFQYPGLEALIAARKQYPQEATVRFYAQDYRKDISGADEEYDLLISQYAGFVSKYCKRYLKVGGLLLVNDSHGDASMASLDTGLVLIAVVLKSGKNHRLSESNLSGYFVPKRPVEVTEAYLEKTQKGIGYKKTASSYVFQCVSTSKDY